MNNRDRTHGKQKRRYFAAPKITTPKPVQKIATPPKSFGFSNSYARPSYYGPAYQQSSQSNWLMWLAIWQLMSSHSHAKTETASPVMTSILNVSDAMCMVEPPLRCDDKRTNP